MYALGNVITLADLQAAARKANDFTEVDATMGAVVGPMHRVTCPADCDEMIRHAHIVQVLRTNKVQANAYSFIRALSTACHQVLVVQPRRIQA